MSSPRKDLMRYVQSIEDWDTLIDAYSDIKKSRGSKLIIKGEAFYINYLIRVKLVKYFRRKVCRYNREQPIDSPIRNIYTGKFVTPENPNYHKTLRVCKIKRLYSTCREIMSDPSDPYFLDPLTGERVKRDSGYGRNVVKKCRKSKPKANVY